MITIEEHEKAVWDAHNNFLQNGVPMGIQCPECDGELYHKNGAILTSYPPQRDVECNKCGHMTRITG